MDIAIFEEQIEPLILLYSPYKGDTVGSPVPACIGVVMLATGDNVPETLPYPLPPNATAAAVDVLIAALLLLPSPVCFNNAVVSWICWCCCFILLLLLLGVLLLLLLPTTIPPDDLVELLTRPVALTPSLPPLVVGKFCNVLELFESFRRIVPEEESARRNKPNKRCLSFPPLPTLLSVPVVVDGAINGVVKSGSIIISSSGSIFSVCGCINIRKIIDGISSRHPIEKLLFKFDPGFRNEMKNKNKQEKRHRKRVRD